jgi:hypothetical protein
VQYRSLRDASLKPRSLKQSLLDDKRRLREVIT